MQDPRQPRFDRFYSQKNPYGISPTPIVATAVAKTKKPGRALDFGCGSGKNAIFLAEQGFEVDAIDISEKAIDQLQESISDKNLAINARVETVENFRFEKKYDLIVCSHVLQAIEKNEVPRLFLEMQAATKKDGYHALAVFSQKSYFFEEIARMRNNNFFAKDLAELKNFYPDWEVTDCYEKEIKIRPTHEDGSPIFSPSFGLLVQKI